MVIFGNNLGRVAILPDFASAAILQVVSLDPDISAQAHRSIITRLSLSQQVNAQFMHTLGSLVYVYVFGDKIGQMTLHGVSFPGLCDANEADGKPMPENRRESTSVEPILQWYNEHKMSRRQQPVRITMGRNIVLEGFIQALSVNVSDAATGLAEWAMQLAILPEH